MTKYFYISDFFLEHITGGGELNDHELINMLTQDRSEVFQLQSHLVTKDILKKNKNLNFIISNFANLQHDCKVWLLENAKYVIYEHDHKYVKTRNPANYKNFKAPDKDIINYSFYKNALSVFVQSSFHEEIMQKNLSLENVVNLSGNLWSLETLSLINDLSKVEKKEKCSILKSNTPHKNTFGAINFCRKKNLKYEEVFSNDYAEFLKQLSRNKYFVFLPKTPETLSRVAVEARMLGCSLYANDLIGACKEPWFKLKGSDLNNFMIEKRLEILNKVKKVFSLTQNNKKKDISIITTYHDGEEFLEKYLKNITNQTIFNNCELLLIDAASSGKEKKIVDKYLKKFDNITFIQLEEKLKPTPCFNIGIKEAKGKYITLAHIDDRKKQDCLELLFNEIEKTNVDLVYGDVAISNIKNESYEENNKKTFFEHSSYEFSKQNMIKCLPGPMPMWKKTMHDKCGFFDDVNHDYADDWDMWLRAVQNGCVFKKLNKTVGLYLSGGRSQQGQIQQRKEEARLFFEHKNLFGVYYDKYKSYFQQFI